MTVDSVDPIDDTSDLELWDGVPVTQRVREPIEPLKMVYGCRIINRWLCSRNDSFNIYLDNIKGVLFIFMLHVILD